MLSSNYNILEKQRAFFLKALESLPVQSRKKIAHALAFAQTAHAGQFRDDGAPYVIHPIRVALSLVKEFDYTSPSLIVAALLHDVVEDCSIPLSRIRLDYGKHAEKIVKDMTDARPMSETEQEKSVRKHKKIQVIRTRARQTRIVKCADLLDNMRSWPLLAKTSPVRKKISRWQTEATLSYFSLAFATDKRMYHALKKAFAASG